MADSVAEQIAALKDEDWAIREEAAMALGTFRDPRAVDPLVVLLRDADRAVRQAAIGAGLPVLPVSIHGSYEAWPPGKLLIRGGLIRVVIDKPVDTDALTSSDTGELRDQVRGIIAGRVEAMGGRVAPVAPP